MKNENELKFVDNSNLGTTQNQNYAPIPNYSPNDNSLSSRLIGTKMVRIRIGTKWKDCTVNKPFFKINTISKIDDNNPQNENELPLLEGEMFIPCFCPVPLRFDFIDAQTRQPFSTSRYADFGKTEGCCYSVFPDQIHSKNNNINDISITKCYDSRSFYRTFEYNGVSYYKIGEPYVPVDCCQGCCQDCCKNEKVNLSGCNCCCCTKTLEKRKRIYVDIFNMSGQVVGKYVCFFDNNFCCCSEPITFFEIYFPSDANEMLKLALIGQLLLLLSTEVNIFGFLPGTPEI